MRFGKALAVAAVVPMLLAAKEPVRLQPSSKWVVEYADDSCRLIRTFGAGEDQSLLVLERPSPTAPMSMLVIGEPFKAHAMASDFVARFHPHEKVQALSGKAAKSADKTKPAILWTHFSFIETVPESEIRDGRNARALQKAMKEARDRTAPLPIDRARQQSTRAEAWTAASRVAFIEIARPRGRAVVLETGSMGQANRMMEACAEQQLRGWGIDPAVEAKIVTPVFAPSVMSWLTPDDYPMESMRKGEESFLTVRLLIDSAGGVTKCTPISPVAADAFGPKVCAAMHKRARFQPARLADGTAVPSYYLQNVRFVLPR